MNPVLIRGSIVTLIAIAAYFGLQHAPLPYVTFTPVGLLGIRPAITGFFVVELFSLFVPPFSWWRREGVGGRSRLNITAWCIMIAYAALQSHLFADMVINGLYSGARIDTLLMSSTAEWTCYLAIIASLVVAFILSYVLTAVISKWGIGNGVVMLIVAETLYDQMAWQGRAESNLVTNQLDLTPLLIVIASVAACVGS